MPAHKVSCPNPACRAVLKLAKPAEGQKIRCPRCGNSFAAGEAEPPQAGPVGLAPEAATCPSCRAVLDPDVVRCQVCGHELAEEPAEGRKAPRRKGRPPPPGTVVPDDLPEEVHQEFSIAERAVEMVGPGTALANLELFFQGFKAGLKKRDPESAGRMEARFRQLRAQFCIRLAREVVKKLQDHAKKLKRKMDALDADAEAEGTAHAYRTGRAARADLAGAMAEERETLKAEAKQLLQTAADDLQKAQKLDPEDTTLKEDLDQVRELAKSGELSVGLDSCFIATAAYGSSFAGEVETLRQFRDGVLMRSAAGRWLVSVYYAVSPALADLLRRTERGRAVVRWLLRPVVRYCRQRLERRE